MAFDIPSVPPPQTIEQTFVPAFKDINSFDNAAMPAAPLNSAAIPNSNHNHWAASCMAESLTSTMSSTYFWIRS